MYLSTYTQPYLLALTSLSRGWEGAKWIFSVAPQMTPSLDCEGSMACPFQGQMTEEPGANPN